MIARLGGRGVGKRPEGKQQEQKEKTGDHG
jgi:hypothetical protein